MLDLGKPWTSYPWIVLDFETDGVDPATCEPVSFACVRWENGKEVGSFYTLLDPGRAIPPECTAIHGIRDEDVKGALTLDQVADDVLELARDALPMAFNVPFDRTIWHRKTMPRGDVPLFHPAERWLDPLVMLRKIDKYAAGAGRHKLAAGCKRWGVAFGLDEQHNALGDVRATARLTTALIEAGKLNPRTKLGRLLDYVDECRAAQNADYQKYRERQAAAAKQTELELGATSTTTEGEPCL